tara:strand:- start:585 stop:806 length:222 start_codon:yes stop_codon:yes gene_type:complete
MNIAVASIGVLICAYLFGLFAGCPYLSDVRIVGGELVLCLYAGFHVRVLVAIVDDPLASHQDVYDHDPLHVSI